jgi:hypothetical protein
VLRAPIPPRLRALAPAFLAGVAAWFGGDAIAGQGATTRPAPADSGAATRSERWTKLAARPLARYGSREVTFGELAEAVSPIYPDVYKELDSAYGETFCDSGALDDWLDAYLDLLALQRDPRSKGLLPSVKDWERGLYERAAAPVPGRLAAYFASSTPANPKEPTKTEIEKARRLVPFETARQVQLDKLVPPKTEEAELRRMLLKDAWKLNTRIRARHLILPIRDEVTEKRFPRDRRENVKSEAERLLARLRGGEPYAHVASQVRGTTDSRPADTLPWLTYDTPLPIPVLRALFESEARQYVGPVETRDGVYIGFVEARERIALPEFGLIRERWIHLVRREEQFALLEKVRGEVAVVVF